MQPQAQAIVELVVARGNPVKEGLNLGSRWGGRGHKIKVGFEELQIQRQELERKP